MNCNKLTGQRSRNRQYRYVQLSGLVTVLFSTALCTAMSMWLASPAMATPQPDEQDIFRYGFDPDMFKPEGLELIVNGWEWQSELSEKQQELVEKTGHRWQVELEHVNAELNAVQKMLSKAGVSYPLDVRSIQNIDDQIRNLKSELIGLTAQLKQLKGESDAEKARMQYEQQVKLSEIELLNTKLDLVNSEVKSVEVLHASKMVPASELISVRVKVAEVETTLKNSRLELQLIQSQLSNNMSAAILACIERQSTLGKQLDELAIKKQAIQKTRPIHLIESLRMRADLARKMIDMAQTKQFELQLENTHMKALIELAKQRMKEHKLKDGSDKEVP